MHHSPPHTPAQSLYHWLCVGLLGALVAALCIAAPAQAQAPKNQNIYLPLVMQTYEPPRRATVTYSLALTNTGSGTVTKLDVYVAIPANRPAQQIDSLVFSAPYETLTDRYGQSVAHFQFTNIGPGQQALITWQAAVQLSKTDFKLDPNRVQGLDQIPADIRAAYTTGESLYRLDSAILQAAAAEAAAGATNPYWIARNIHDFVANRLTYDNDHSWSDAEVIYLQQSGSCTEYTYLFIALCRLNGIPARYLGATLMRGDSPYVDTVYHRWAEIYLPPYGWVPVDVQGDDSTPISYARFGAFGNHGFITTVSGGGSEYLNWNYHDRYTYYASGSVTLQRQRSFTWVESPAP